MGKRISIIGTALFLAVQVSGGPLEDLKPGCWYEAPNSHMEDVRPPGGTDPYCVMSCWAGGCFDSKRDRLYVTGGGHAGYAGNEIYAFDVNELRWIRLNDPAPVIPGTEWPDSTQPKAFHSYNGVQYLPPPVDRFWILGVNYGTFFQGVVPTWTFNLDALAWERKANLTFTDYRTQAFSAYDPLTGKVWCNAGMNSAWYLYDPATDTWTNGGQSGNCWYSNASAIDSKRRKLATVGVYQAGGKVYKGTFTQDLNGSAIGPWTMLATTGDASVDQYQGEGPGFVYDPVADQLVAWTTGAEIHTLDLDTRVWTRHPPATSNTVTPTAPNGNGTFGRFRYVPSKNVFIVVNNTDENVFFYKFTSAHAESLAVTSLSVYPSDTTVTELTLLPVTVVANRAGGSRDTVTNSCVIRSLDSALAIIQDGSVLALKQGAARIEIKKNTASVIVRDTLTVTITAGSVTADSIVISPSKMAVFVGNQFQFHVTGCYHNSFGSFTRNEDQTAQWVSANTANFTVADGLVRGLAADPAALRLTATLGSKSDTAWVTVMTDWPVPSFLRRINFQVTAVPHKSGWTADNGRLYSGTNGFGWIDTAGIITRADRNGDNYLLKTFVLFMAPKTYRMDAPDGTYILKIGMGDNLWADKGYQWVAHGGDTLITNPGCACNVIKTDTITVSGGTGIVLNVRGAINYLVVISSEGIDIDYAADDGLLPSLEVSRNIIAGRQAGISLASYPNPFNPRTVIRFSTGGEGPADLKIYSADGRLVRTLMSFSRVRNGVRECGWDGRDDRGNAVGAGLYFASLSWKGARKSLPVLLMR